MAPSKIGWYGLGSMGLGMATNLQKHISKTTSENLVYCNRSMNKGDSLKELGAKPESDFAKLVQQTDVIFTMISNDAVLNDLISQATSSGDITGKIFVDTSTVSAETSKSVSGVLNKKGAKFCSAPVFGASPVAAAGKLVFAIGGPADARETVKPLIQDVMGRSVIDLGEDESKAALLKVTGNILTIGFMEIIAEAQVLAEKTGLGVDTLDQLIGDAFGPVAGGYSKRLATGTWAPQKGEQPGFGVSLSIKDANHALQAASDVKATLPAFQIARDNMVRAREHGGESMDSSSMYGPVREDSGLPFFDENTKRKQ